MSFKDADKDRLMHSKSDNDKADELCKECFESLLFKSKLA